MSKAKHGIYAATITPVTPEGTPDLAKLARYSKRLIEEGLTGVAPAGTTGEGNSIPMASRLEMPSHFRELELDSDRVIFGTGACSADDAIRLTLACVDASYTNVLVLPPFYYKSAPESGLYAYYSRLIEGVGNPALRVYLYHFPQMSMTPISISLVERLKAEYGAIIAGLKDSSGDYEGSLAFARAADDFDVFPSSESFLCRALKDGCAGIISATLNACPALAARTLALRSEEDQTALAELRDLISTYPLSAALKKIEAWKSGDNEWNAVLPPLAALNETNAVELHDRLRAFSSTGCSLGI